VAGSLGIIIRIIRIKVVHLGRITANGLVLQIQDKQTVCLVIISKIIIMEEDYLVQIKTQNQQMDSLVMPQIQINKVASISIITKEVPDFLEPTLIQLTLGDCSDQIRIRQVRLVYLVPQIQPAQAVCSDHQQIAAVYLGIPKTMQPQILALQVVS